MLSSISRLGLFVTVVTLAAGCGSDPVGTGSTSTLTVTKAGSGTGTITSSPAGITCGATCTVNFRFGTVVTLTAAPAAGSSFAGWSGPCTGTGTCVVTVNAAITVTATFNLQQFTVTVAKSGLAASDATVSSSPAGITCGATCSGTFTYGTAVTLTTTVAGAVFAGWSGAGCSGVGDCGFTVTGTTAITASYRGARVAISAGETSCLRDAGNSGDRARTLLGNRGHTAAFVAAADIDTPAEIAAYDVIVIGGPGAACASIDASGYDGVIDDYIRVTGGGVVTSGWLLYNALDRVLAPNLIADLPTVQNRNYLSGTQTVTPVAGSPITTGLGAFTSAEYVPYGGGPKTGATSLLTVAPNSVGASWTLGNGRTVYLGPMYLEDYVAYQNENLLDGTQAASVELFLRAVEWAAKAR